MQRGPRDSFGMKWIVFWNTHIVAPRWLFRRVVTDADYDRVLGLETGRPRSLPYRVMCRLLWFWPRVDDASGWADAQAGGQWNPEQYLHTDQTELVAKILEIVPRDASVMELGCNCGSDMAQLHQAGFTRLSGVDVGEEALLLFQREYPQTWDVATIERDLFQRYLDRTPSKSVDYIYSNGATIELVHPSYPVVSEICRVARRGVLLDLSERQQGYPRDYVGQFARHGFAMVYSNKEQVPYEKSHIFAFEQVTDRTRSA